MKQNVPIAGVIGNSISHSKSPKLHQHWLRRYGIRGEYVPLHVESKNLESVIRSMPKMGFVGANVTIPHKVDVMQFADQISDRATLVGAANTLIFKDDGKITRTIRMATDLWPTCAKAHLIGIRNPAPPWF